MSNFSLGVSLFGAMLTLMILRVPISVAMFLPGAIGYCSIT
jgi:C4-dicarboxylate transporter, DctM subunit